MTPSRTLLLYDEEPLGQHMLARKLQRTGLEVLVAQDGESVAKLAREHSPALVLADMHAGSLNGLELAARLGPETPLLLMDESNAVLNPAVLAATNVRYVIRRPFSAGELILRIRHILEGRDDETAPPVERAQLPQAE